MNQTSFKQNEHFFYRGVFPVTWGSKIGQPNLCVATLITSVSFTSKLEFFIHNFGKKKSKILRFLKFWE